MESFLAFLIASAVTFFFVRRYVKGLQASKKSGGADERQRQLVTGCRLPAVWRSDGEGCCFLPGMRRVDGSLECPPRRHPI